MDLVPASPSLGRSSGSMLYDAGGLRSHMRGKSSLPEIGVSIVLVKWSAVTRLTGQFGLTFVCGLATATAVTWCSGKVTVTSVS
jgi:hypothetical protein